MKRTAHPAMRALVDRHFSGRISPAEERAMREHLPECAGCHRYYERHLALAALVPGALDEDSRLAIGLGFDRQLPPSGGRGVALGLVGAAAAVLLGLALLLPRAEPPFLARGGKTTSAGVELLVYRLAPGMPPSLADDEIRSEDELAFAYRNAAGKKRLLVFGIDDEANVYWYHPAWRREGENPTAIPIEMGNVVCELREAVRQPIRGRTLQIVGLFTDEALTVRTIETWLQQARMKGVPLPPFPGALQTSTSFAVRPQGGRP